MKVTSAATSSSRTKPEAPNELLRLLIDGVRDYAIFALDPKGTILTWNTGAARLKGYTADEIVGRDLRRYSFRYRTTRPKTL